MKLWLVRHAQPLIEPGLCYGATDMPADSQATLACAQALAQVLPPGLLLLTSPLQRCEQLAQALQVLRPDLHAVRDARLAEMDFGCWEGVRWDAIPQQAYAQWTAAFGTCRFGGRESVQDLLQRVSALRLETQERAEESVWITHAGVIRAMSLLAQGLYCIDRAEQWPQQAPGFGEWLALAL